MRHCKRIHFGHIHTYCNHLNTIALALYSYFILQFWTYSCCETIYFGHIHIATVWTRLLSQCILVFSSSKAVLLIEFNLYTNFISLSYAMSIVVLRLFCLSSSASSTSGLFPSPRSPHISERVWYWRQYWTLVNVQEEGGNDNTSKLDSYDIIPAWLLWYLFSLTLRYLPVAICWVLPSHLPPQELFLGKQKLR